jgi:hypothetical protein
VTAAATLTASAAAPTAGAETRTEAGAAESRAAETGAVREAGQPFRREVRARVLGEVAGAETTGAEAAVTVALVVLAQVFAVTVVLVVSVATDSAAAFLDPLTEGPAHVAERAVPVLTALTAGVEWIVTHGRYLRFMRSRRLDPLRCTNDISEPIAMQRSEQTFGEVAGQRKALRPVTDCPTVRACTSSVPS